MSQQTCYHVTNAENAASILEAGFEGGWGDVGFGVYVFTDLTAAQAYLARGGWDEGLDSASAVILKIRAPEHDLEPVEPHPDWPDQKAYEVMMWHPMEDEDEIWAPECHILEGDTPAPI